MANDFGVRDEKATALAARFAELGVRSEDLVERFVRSSGPGGQNVNKNATAVYLKHVPSGVEVKAQQSRSQALNRFYARRSLADKLEALRDGRSSKEQQKIDKLRRQKQRRRRRTKRKAADANPEPPTQQRDRET
ncbi:MAG: peptide chain release factor-like protein [Myxococcota bacterium]